MRNQANAFAACCDNCARAGLAPLSAWDDWFATGGVTTTGTVTTTGLDGLVKGIADLVNLGLGVKDAIDSGDRIVTPGGQVIYTVPAQQAQSANYTPLILGGAALLGGILLVKALK